MCLASTRSRFLSSDTATTAIYTLSLHDALPICGGPRCGDRRGARACGDHRRQVAARRHRRQEDSQPQPRTPGRKDRKSTRLNSSHLGISYAVFCLKKKKKQKNRIQNKQTKLEEL